MIEPTYYSHASLPQWQKDIIFRYPDIYLTPNLSIDSCYREGNSSFCNLRMGFEFDAGWTKLVDEFSSVADQLVKLLHQSGLQPNAFIRSHVFKEKMGRLRWQGNHNLIQPFAALFNAYAAQLLERSVHVCELTGEYGELRDIHRMWKTLCAREYKRLLDKYTDASSQPNLETEAL